MSYNVLLSIILSFSFESALALGQSEKKTSSCNYDQAIELIRQQVNNSKSVDDIPVRIVILTKAADLLWNYDQPMSRLIYNDAYELAVEYHSKPRARSYLNEAGVRVAIKDSRRVVIESIGQHDSPWATELNNKWKQEDSKAKETPKDLKDLKATSKVSGSENGEGEENTVKLAISLLPTDKTSAINLVKTTFRSPISDGLPNFLFKLAERDVIAANNLWLEAVSRYSQDYSEKLFFLSLYPFALSKVPTPTLSYAAFQLPKDFKPNLEQQRHFLQVVSKQAEFIINNADTTSQSAPQTDALNYPASLYLFLKGLNPLISEYQPALAASTGYLITQLEQKVSQVDQYLLKQKEQSIPNRPYEDLVAEFENGGDPRVRDFALLWAIFRAPASEDSDRLERLAGKISDINTRREVSDWLAFNNSKKKIKSGQADDVLLLLNKINRADLKAHLMLEVAAHIKDKVDNETSAGRKKEHKQKLSDLLTEIVALASQSEDSNEKARALLGATYYFVRLNAARAVEVATAAVVTINRIKKPEVESQYVNHLITGPGDFSFQAQYDITAYNINNVFKELGSAEFEDSLLLSQDIMDAQIRSSVILTLSSICLGKKSKEKSLVTPSVSGDTHSSSKPNHKQPLNPQNDVKGLPVKKNNNPVKDIKR